METSPWPRGRIAPSSGTPYVASDVHGESGLDGPDLPEPKREVVEDDAVNFIAARICEAEQPVTLVATGPLTNVAVLIERCPEAAGQVDRIVLMGGAIAEGNVTPAAEFNIWADPEAAARVFSSGLDVTMIGLDVTHKALLLPEHADRLRASGRTGAFVADLFAFYHRFHAETYDFPGSPVHDAVAVAFVARPELVTTLRRNVVVETDSELCRGRTVVDLWRRTEREPNCTVGVDIDSEAFLELLVERLAGIG